MKKRLFMLLLCVSATTHAMGIDDDPLLTMLRIDKLERQQGTAGTPWLLQAEAWAGRDLNKLWLKTEGELFDGTLEEGEVQLLYSRAIAPFWDLQLGLRHDIHPTPQRNWLALGVQGLTPYMFELDAALFIGNEGRGAARIDAEYEYLLSRRLVLIPELEANFYSKDDPQLGIGRGLSKLTLGLRLAYELRREFAPYLGYSWSGLYGGTADYAEAAGEERHSGSAVLGVRMWF